MGKRGPKPDSDKRWADAIRVAVMREGEDKRTYLARLAEECVQRALEGDMTAMREIGDRLDGRPHQASTTTVDATDPLLEAIRQIQGRQ